MARFGRDCFSRHTGSLLAAVLLVALSCLPAMAFGRHAAPSASAQTPASSQQSLPPLSIPNTPPPSASNAPNTMAVLPPQELAFIGTLENSLYGVRYDQDAVTVRLSRIEQTVFGEARDQMSLSDRLGLLHQTISKAQTAPPLQATQNPQQQPDNPQAAQSPPPQAQQPARPLPDESDYPAVTALEQRVLGQSFVGQDITARLNRLEMATYHNVRQGALSDRVANLQMLVFGSTHPQAANPAVVSTDDNGNDNNDGNGYNNGGGNNYGPPQPDPAGPGNNTIATTPADMAAATTQVEKQVLKQTYPNDPEDMRLSRLETRLFNNTSPEMSPEDRLQRIIAVSAGGGDNAGAPAPSTFKSKAAAVLPILLPIVITVLFGLL